MKARVRDIDVHYEEAGSGRPLVVLHGGGQGLNGHVAMDAFEPVLAGRDRWRRIYPDQLGHGRTPLPEWAHRIDSVVDVLAGLIDVVAPGEGFAVLGWSWGGYVARGLIHRMQKRIDGAMLLVPEMDWGPPGKRVAPPKQLLHRAADFQQALRAGEEWLDDFLKVQTVPVLEHVRRTFKRVVDHPDTDAAFHKQEGGFTFDPDALPEPCMAPALILTGRQDNITGYRQAWAILDNFPRATYAVLDRAGHLLQIEQPALFAALTYEWLDRAEEYAGLI